MKTPLVCLVVLIALAIFTAWEAAASDLTVAISSGNPILLSWSTNIPSFAIESKTNLDASSAWRVVASKPTIAGANFVVTNYFTEPSRFFRLSNWPQKVCFNQTKQIGLALEVWAMDNGDRFPFHVPTNQGGTMELRAIGPDGFDANSWLHFQVLSNELTFASVLVCRGDVWRTSVTNFADLQPENVTYKLRTGDTVLSGTPGEILAVCPIDGNTLYCDATVTQGTNYLK